MVKHYDNLDVLRGINIILVLVGHAIAIFVGTEKLTLSSAPVLVGLNEIFHCFRMPLFFMISGLLIDKFIVKPYKKAIKTKILRLLVPYFIWSFVAVVGMELVSRYTPLKLSLGLNFNDFFNCLVVPFWIYWFLYTLFFFFVGYYIIYKICPLYAKKLFFIISLFLQILYLLDKIPHIWILNTISMYLLYFSLGTFILEYFGEFFLQRITKKHLLFVTILLMILSISFMYSSHILDNIILSKILRIVVTFIGSYYIFCLSQYIYYNIEFLRKYLKDFGVNSIIVYCIHMYIITMLIKISIFVFKVHEMYFLQISIYSIIATYICYVIFSKWIKPTSKFRILFGEKPKIKF